MNNVLPPSNYNIEELYKNYINMLDPTEYYYAIKYLNSWSNWEAFCLSHPDEVGLWRRELEAKIKSMCLSHIIETSRGETRDSLQAAKYLLETPWVKDESKRGRPSKVEVQNELKNQAETYQRIQADLLRMQNASR